MNKLEISQIFQFDYVLNILHLKLLNVCKVTNVSSTHCPELGGMIWSCHFKLLLQSLCNNLFSGATRPMCFYDTIKWIHLLRSCSCDDLTSCCRSIREMLCLNWIKFSSCRDSLSSATSRSTPHSLPYIQLNAPVTCTFSLDWTCRDVAAHLPPPQPESDDQPP